MSADENTTAPSRTPARIFLECTWTRLRGATAGIPRVVRGVIQNSRTIADARSLHCQAVVIADNKILPAGDLNIPSGGGITGSAMRSVSRIASAVPAIRTALSRNAVGRAAIDAAFKCVQCAGSIASAITNPTTPIRLSAGDLLVMLDASWSIYPWRLIAAARCRGAKVAGVLYDLLPARMPDAFNADLSTTFNNWLSRAAMSHDFFLAISEATRQDFLKYFAEKFPHASPPPVEVFRLGADLDRKQSAGVATPQTAEFFASANLPYLIVCTLEPRKNHAFLLDAFDILWSKGLDARLAIVGRVGWRCGELVARIKNHPRFGRDLMMFNDASDADVAYCYEHSRATVFPSLAEGFGLPIVESLNRGRPVLASDIPVHREAGGEHCVYFPLDNPAKLAAIIEQHLQTGQLPPHRPPGDFRWIDWRQSAEQFLDKAIKLYCQTGGK